MSYSTRIYTLWFMEPARMMCRAKGWKYDYLSMKDILGCTRDTASSTIIPAGAIVRELMAKLAPNIEFYIYKSNPWTPMEMVSRCTYYTIYDPSLCFVESLYYLI